MNPRHLNINGRLNAARMVVILLLMPVLSFHTEAQQPEQPVRQDPDTLPSFMIEAEKPDYRCSVPEGLPPSPDFYTYASQYKSLMPWHVSRQFSIAPQTISPSVASWETGRIYASGSTTSMPGMMGIESGRLNVSQSAGPVTFTVWAESIKYGYFRGLQTGWGFGGTLDYRISDRWSVTLFGNYYSPVHPLTPGMAESMSIPRFGGFASYNFSEHWGISVGAQTSRSLVTNQWETRPIVTPYYRINSKVNIGVDIGDILYNVVRSYIDRRDSRHGPPAMNMPRPAGAPRPRR